MTVAQDAIIGPELIVCGKKAHIAFSISVPDTLGFESSLERVRAMLAKNDYRIPIEVRPNLDGVRSGHRAPSINLYIQVPREVENPLEHFFGTVSEGIAYAACTELGFR